MLSAWLVSVAMSTTMVPPGHPVENHASVGKSAQPTIQLFERKAVDRARRANWNAYVAELDVLWADFRAAGSTDAAMADYKFKANAAKIKFLYNDPYLLPIIDD
ncbi:hypothetical protein ETAA8_33610 [Anatilimnocola aggregata]|uniref:Uncharacterized protein n=1 Tax=Anatilimnocola aggregata TaxID=2528021 RepID=A0A517YDE8_9BACT|nr:hypothetical protein [Anatilimnocola aggregata]QDU28261.1 hypothetical protein ETAA8_33610 [Anatilimnocola aggregata]